MKKPLFNKMTALVMSSLVVFSGQALAMKSNKQEVTNAEALREVEFLIAQNSEELIISEDKKKIAVEAITDANTDLGQAKACIAILETGQAKSIVVNLLNIIETLIGEAKAITNVEKLSKGQAEVALKALNAAQSQLGDVIAQLRVLLPNDPGAQNCLNQALRALQEALQEARAKLELAIQSAE